MEITERLVEGTVVLALAGDVDLETSPQLRTLLEERPCGPLVLDFAGVNYIDSSGLATLIEHYQKMAKGAKAAPGAPKPRLVLAALSPRVRGAFELVRLNEIFPDYPDVAQAVRSLAEPARA